MPSAGPFRARLAIALLVLLMLRAQAPPGYAEIELQSSGAGGAAISGLLRRPAGDAPRPVVIMLHGCGGHFTRSGALQSRTIDWADRLAAAGYAVLLLDSFTRRGIREVCTQRFEDRGIRPADRAHDVAAAVAWLGTQGWVDRGRIGLIGWSHGGSTVLASVDRRLVLPPPGLRLAIAFYPGCRPAAESARWSPATPLSILIGSADDWTPPEPCRLLKQRFPEIGLTEYPRAVHGFDAPHSKLRVREGLGVGRAHVGTDPAARTAAITEVERLLREAFR